MLCGLLNSHPEIVCHHELFNAEFISYALDCRDGDFSLGCLEERDRDPLAFLRRVWQEKRGRPLVGFKFCRGQPDEVLRALLQDGGVAKIVLKRRNRIKTFVSVLMSQTTGQWEVYNEAELIRERPRVQVSTEELHRNISLNDEFYRTVETALAGSGQEYLGVYYEDLADDRERRRLLKFLKVAPDVSVLRVPSVKQNPTDLRRIVANFDELSRALGGTDLAAELTSSGL
jgi:hypothetical protein